MLVLLFVALWFILRGDLILCLTLCHFVLVFFSPFSIAITSLGEERANLSAFCTFVRFVLVWICRFPLPLVSGKGCGLLLWHSLDFFQSVFALQEWKFIPSEVDAFLKGMRTIITLPP